MAVDPAATAAERYFLRKAEEVAQVSAQVSADLSALRVRVEEQGRSIQDLRAQREPFAISLLRLLVLFASAFALGAVWRGGHAP